jgi:catechol 2,3-dioxygenase-like lactoylglutathione lyase family enzyme
MSTEQAGGPAAGPVTAAYHHVGISAADITALEAWYCAAFGLARVAEHHPSPAIMTRLLRGANGLQVELLAAGGSRRAQDFASPVEAALAQGYGHWAIEVEDVGSAFAFLAGSGARPAKEPAEGPNGKTFAYIRDPEGNLIELIQR